MKKHIISFINKNARGIALVSLMQISFMVLAQTNQQKRTDPVPYLDNYYGYCTPDKKILRAPKYEKAYRFKEECSLVFVNGKLGLS